MGGSQPLFQHGLYPPQNYPKIIIILTNFTKSSTPRCTWSSKFYIAALHPLHPAGTPLFVIAQRQNFSAMHSRFSCSATSRQWVLPMEVVTMRSQRCSSAAWCRRSPGDGGDGGKIHLGSFGNPWCGKNDVGNWWKKLCKLHGVGEK